jgi:hypothetical protein
MSNTKKTVTLNFFTYFDKSESAFVGVCFELGIIKVDANGERLKRDLVEAAIGYVETVCKENLSTDLLNQEPPQKYVEIYKRYIGSLVAETPIRPTKIFDFSNAGIFSRPVLCPMA